MKKALGPGMIKLLCNKCPEYVLRVYNTFSKDEIFPTEWKIVKLVLLPKSQNTREIVTSYRPICVLDVEGKLYEALIAGRLEEEVHRTDGLSNNQYEFRRTRQTIHTVNRVIDIATEAARYSGKHREICAVLTQHGSKF